MSIIDNGNVYGYRTTGAVSFIDQDRIGRIVNILGKRDLRMLLPLFEADAADADAVQDIGQRSNHFIKHTTSDFDPVLKGSVLAYRLNGVDEGFYMADNDQFSFGADGTAPNEPAFSVGCAVRFNDVIDNTLIARYDITAGSNQCEYQLLMDAAGKVNFYVYDSVNAVRIGRLYNTALVVNRWYIIVATYDASRASTGIDIYLDGVVVDDTANDAGAYTAMDNMSVVTSIGYNEDGAGALANFLDGDIAFPFITARELSAADVLNLTNIYREVLNIG